ncbi:MAG: hypothetical protein DCC68_16435 [Planctomycetota bacterium]|nr:MAG: hypothetical protein DCC68_16435 [Planctomycetota bacterium]
MYRAITLVAVLALLGAASAHAIWGVSDKGTWPATWPKELEPLRTQSKSYTGSLVNRTFHEIRFATREEFEAAWPHLLKVKTDKAPIFLSRSPVTYLGPVESGVRVWMALASSKPMPPGPIAGVKNERERWIYTTHIELIVDGKIVDLNRIPLPKDTPIVDERFDKK